MSDRTHARRKTLGRSSSTESTDFSTTMGRSVRKKKPKERWLLTRKTWRYMTDAGKKLIPDGAQNRPEDIPKIEAYFQEVCKKEAKFLLWRKNSYPGALVFRKKQRKERRKGGSCRKATSADEVDIFKPERPTNLAIPSTSGGRFDIQKMKLDFLNKPPTPTDYSSLNEQPNHEEENQLVNMLEQYLTLANKTSDSNKNRDSININLNQYKSRGDINFNYQELVDKLQRHLTLVSHHVNTSSPYTTYHSRPNEVRFQGDHVQKSLSETLSRYFSQSSNRDKVISDLLTDRKTLEKLYFDLRKTKGFRGSRGGTGYSTTKSSSGISTTSTGGGLNYKLKSTNSGLSGDLKDKERRKGTSHPPPLIEIVSETITFRDNGIQTVPIPEIVLTKVEEEYKKMVAERDEDDRRDNKAYRRRSSVDNDDVSQSVSDTIKRYLRMARKKSVDTDKADRFKRVNYDRNLRNIKAKGEITKPGDDDGLNKGCQTNEDWILTYRDLKFDELASDDSRVSSSRSSIDVGVVESNPSSPPGKGSGGHSFLSNLLHHHGSKNDKSSSAAAAVTTAAAMQKSKSSSSVMHHGSRLMAKKIFRSRSKSQTRPSHTPSSWTPQGTCVWSNIAGRQVILSDTNLLHLTDIERKVLQKVAIAKLQALSLGVSIKIPTENVGVSVSKPKRRPYLRKALTTGIFDTSRKDSEKEKDGASGGLVFGIPLTQCVENDRLSKAAAGTSPFRSQGDLHRASAEEPATMGRHGSRASFSSLIEGPRGDDSGSCESLMSRGVGSVPGLLDALSCGSTTDLPGSLDRRDTSVPNILTVCFRHIEQYGLHTLGIFRVSTSKKRIRQLREDFDCGKETTLDDEQCPHDVATLLKEYLRDLPDPLLCRELYHAFVQTQRIRNRRLQFEALQHLIQLLPSANIDTLYALLSFLAVVAKNSDDSTDPSSGETITGNKMDSSNLATVFAPNILHCIKPGAKDTAQDRPEDRIDIINVVRTLIDHFRNLYVVPAELLDEIYVHMMDSHPEALDQLLNKRDAIAAADESVDELDSESYSAPWTPTMPTAEMSIDNLQNFAPEPSEPKKTYSREEFLHETAATGGPNVGMRIRHKDRIRERSSRRKREESSTRKRPNEEQSLASSGLSSAKTIISRLRGQRDDDYQYGKNRSSSLESSSSTHTDSDVNRILKIQEDLQERRKSSPYVLNNSGVITASLTIPVQQQQSLSYNVDDDIPYIEDVENGRQQLTIGLVRTPTAPPRRRQHSVSGSDSSVASNIQPITGSISLVQSYDSAVGSSATYSSPVQNTPTSISSSIADQGTFSSPPSWASTPPTSPDSAHTSVNYIPDDIQPPKPITKSKGGSGRETPVLQKVSFSSTQEIQQIRGNKDGGRSQQMFQRQSSTSSDIHKSVSSTPGFESSRPEREPKFTPSITSIGNAVMRSKTADFERITKTDSKPTKTTSSSSSSEKKKYTKRRYTDSRHPTRHIPDSEALESQSKKEDKSSSSQSGQFYKRRELISSVPSK